MNIHKLLDAYYDKLVSSSDIENETKKYDENLIKANKRCLEALGIKNAKKIRLSDGYKMIRYYREIRGNRNNSINKYMWFLKRALKDSGIITDIQLLKNLKKDTIPFSRIYHDELKDIIDYVKNLKSIKNNPIYQTVVFLLLDSGVRINELLNIKIKNIDFKSKRILLEKTKNKSIRVVPFSEFSYEYIEKTISLGPKRENLLWNIDMNIPLTKNAIRQFYRRMRDKLRLNNNIHSHRFRKTFASMLRENNARLETIQKLLGHSKISTTMIYIEQTDIMVDQEYRDKNPWR